MRAATAKHAASHPTRRGIRDRSRRDTPGFGGNCAACHETPFLRVRDRTCLKCHDKIPGHVMPVSLQVELFGGTRCASCHADHKGPDGLVRRDAGMCAALPPGPEAPPSRHRPGRCRRLRHRASGIPRSARGPVPAATDMARVAQSDKARLVEQSHLKYPHDVHLKPNIRGRQGSRHARMQQLPRARRLRTLVRPDQHEPALPRMPYAANSSRPSPSGRCRTASVDDVMATMQEFYANLALKDVAVDVVDTGDIRRSIPQRVERRIVSDDQRRRALAWADRKGAVVAQDLFEKRVCIVCHEVVKTTGPGKAPGEHSCGASCRCTSPTTYHAQGALRPRQAHDRSSAPTATRASRSRSRAATSRCPTSPRAASATPAARRPRTRSCRRACHATASTSPAIRRGTSARHWRSAAPCRRQRT